MEPVAIITTPKNSALLFRLTQSQEITGRELANALGGWQREWAREGISIRVDRVEKNAIFVQVKIGMTSLLFDLNEKSEDATILIGDDPFRISMEVGKF